MIENIRVRDFRGIRQGARDRFCQFNVLVGPNNSGKSTLLEALYLAATASREADCTVRYRQSDRKDATFKVKVAAPDLLGEHPMRRVRARHNYAEQQSGLAEWSQGFLRVTLRDPELPVAALDLFAGERGFAEAETQATALFALDPPEPIEIAHRPEREPVGPLATALLGSNAEPFTGKRLVFCWQPELSYYYKGSSAWIVEGTTAVAAHTLYFDAESVRQHVPVAFYQRMLNSVPGWTQRIARSFGHIFDLNQPFVMQFVPTSADRNSVQGSILSEDRPAIPIDAFGDGARSAFKLLTPLVALAASATPAAPGLLLWEEPESYQNPKTLERLLGEVVRLLKGRPVQVFMATHSLEVVAQITAMLQNGQLAPKEFMLFHLDLKDGELVSSWFDRDNLVTWLEAGLDPRVWRDFVSPFQFRLRQEEA